MSRMSRVCAVLAAVACIALTGCMKPTTIEKMKADMPERPSQLDRLDQFAGKWRIEGTTQFAMLDEPLKISGTSEYHWDGDRWYLIGDSVMNMEHFGDTKMLEAWTYDVHDTVYRSVGVDSMGATGSSVVKYNEKNDTWIMKGDGYGPFGKSKMMGEMRFPDPDTMEWTFTQKKGLTTVMEMTGTGKRVE